MPMLPSSGSASDMDTYTGHATQLAAISSHCLVDTPSSPDNLSLHTSHYRTFRSDYISLSASHHFHSQSLLSRHSNSVSSATRSRSLSLLSLSFSFSCASAGPRSSTLFTISPLALVFHDAFFSLTISQCALHTFPTFKATSRGLNHHPRLGKAS